MRFVDLGVVTPEYSVCADKVLLKNHTSADDDTLLIYSRDRACISVGRFQRTEESIDLDYVKKNNISVVRRISGGSNIYTDTNQLTYSVVLGKDRLPPDRNDSFAVICSAVLSSLKELNINGVHKPVNDILVNGKKISGSAQARSLNAVLQHGSIILDVDDRVVRSSLKDNKKRSYDGLTSIKECLGYIPPRDEMTKAFMTGFSEVFGEVKEGTLTVREISEIRGSAELLLA
jgi:lipoate-protein ligase A